MTQRGPRRRYACTFGTSYPIVVTEPPITLRLRDEPFGQRRFGLFDPAGTWVDVVEQIDPVPGWWDR